jgi:hypothetical protein
MYFYYNDQQPHVENMVQVTSESTINNISKYVGQNIYLSYKRSDGNTYYLGNLAANNCLDLQKKSDGSCLTNVAIIQETIDTNSIVKITQLIGQTGSYFMTSLVNGTSLAHKLNAPDSPSPFLCFASGHTLNDITFTIGTSNTGYLLVFNVKNVPYYVSECGIGSVCTYGSSTFLKLCLNLDVSKAISFNFNLVPPTQESSKVETFDDLSEFSNFSLFSQDANSNCDTMSLPGPGNIDEFASWSHLDNDSLR